MKRPACWELFEKSESLVVLPRPPGKARVNLKTHIESEASTFWGKLGK